MEFIAIVLFLIGAGILLWLFTINITHEVPDVKKHGLTKKSRKVNDADKKSTKNAKRDQRRRKKKMITQSGGTEEQDLTPDRDCPIKTGQTANVGGKPSLLPYDACEKIVDTSSSSKLAKEPWIAVATNLPSRSRATGDAAERPCSLSSDICKKSREVPNLPKSEPMLAAGENDGCTTTLRYIARSDIPRITGKGGRITKLLEKRYGVKIDVPQLDNGNIVISGGNKTTRLAVEASIRERLIMTITLPNVDAHVRAAIQKQVDQGKLKILNESFEMDQSSVTITGLTRDCKVILDVPKCH